MRDLRFFDAHCYLGRTKQRHPGSPQNAEALLQEMDRSGIEEALVIHAMSREHHPAAGNPAILHEIEVHSRLHPAWSVLPPRSGELPAPDELVKAMRDAKVRALWLFPAHYMIPLRSWALEPLLEVMQRDQIPLFLDSSPEIMGWHSDVTDWDGLRHLCLDYPNLPVILAEARFRSSNRLIYQLLEQCPNLHLELSGYWGYRGIEFICREFGANRLLFGTRLPVRNPGCAVSMVSYAEIPDDDKQAIAGGNLRRLLSWAPEPKNHEPKHCDTCCGKNHISAPGNQPDFRNAGLQGNSLAGERVIDIHTHLGNFSYYHVPDGETDSVVREMERVGVEHACLFSFAGVNSDFVYGNNVIAEAIRRHPDRFTGFSLVSPNYPEEMVPELERCRAMGFKGVKLIADYQGYPAEGRALEPAIAFAHENHWPVLNHHWGSPSHLDRLARDYPNAVFIIGHFSLSYAEVLKNRPNVCQCTCAALMINDIERLVEIAPLEKILFGSDFTDLPLPFSLGPVLFARISDDAKRTILGLNAVNILRGISGG